MKSNFTLLFSLMFFLSSVGYAQLFLNEGSNKNYATLADEDGDFEDWIEIYNAGPVAVDLFNYSLSDNANPGEWVFGHQLIQPNEYVIVFCSEKDRAASSPFTPVLIDTTFQPQTGWNTHHFTTPLYWDGLSNIVLNICTYNSYYTNNSIHSLSATTYNSSTIAVSDGMSTCVVPGGGNSQLRPNIRLNATGVGSGLLQNGYTDYPSPYGNWYWGSRQQYLYRASELLAAGLTAGTIDSIGFDVIAPCPTGFAYLELSLSNSGRDELESSFIPANGNANHTNFKISSSGETIRLYNPAHVEISALNVNCGPGYDVSTGRVPDAGAAIKKFYSPTPGSSNNFALAYDQYVIAPVFSALSGVYSSAFSVSIYDANNPPAAIYYTLDGSDPDSSSAMWNGTPIPVGFTTILRARAYKNGFIPSTITSASFLFNVNHVTPIISVISDASNLFGPTGMFDNPTLDLLKAASIDYFDSTSMHSLLFSRRAGIIMDGGWGSRGNPQRPFRIKLDDGVLGQGPVIGTFLSDRSERTKYSDFYLFNGGGNYMVLPFKDAVQVKMMGDGSQGYYPASRPVSVYVNGSYWGLYDMKEKYNSEFFEIYDNASGNSVEILGSSAQYNFQLRAIEGDVQHFYDSYQAFSQLNPQDTGFWNDANTYFDMTYYNDYIIGELWMNNVDWAFNYNNIKIYRSNASNYSWRYCLMDLEYGLLPNHSSLYGGNAGYNCTFDLLGGLLNHANADPGNPHLGIFWKSIQNDRFKNYFINRFADQMNTLYLPSRILSIENSIYNLSLPEMGQYFSRWGDPSNVPAQLNGYAQYHQLFSDELSCRPEQMRNHILSNFNLPKQVDVLLDVFPSGAGRIKISTVKPEQYPWTGIYFDGVPVKIEALALPGYAFSHWESNGLIQDTMQALFLDTLSLSTLSFKAHFSSTAGLDVAEALSFSLYPNPAVENLFIHLKNQNQGIDGLEVIDLIGKSYTLPYSRVGDSDFILSVSQLSKGCYLIKVKDRQGASFQRRFIKQ